MEVKNRCIPAWFERVSSGQLKLPRFQRFEAWDSGRVESLLEAVFQGLPVGATLILEVGDREPFQSRYIVGAPPSTERVTEHLLDGQQRLTAIWRGLNDNYPDRTYFLDLNSQEGDEIAPKVRGVARWVKNGEKFPLWADQPAKIHERNLVPVKLLRPGDIAAEIGEWCLLACEGVEVSALRLQNKLNDFRARVTVCNIPILSLPVVTPKDVALDVFIKLNTSGVVLRAFDILVAQIEEAAGRSLHDLVSTLKTAVPRLSRYVDASDVVLNIAALREDRPPSRASYFKLDLVNMVSDWQRLVEGIDAATAFLEEEKIFDAERLPTFVVIPVLAALHQFVPRTLDQAGNAKTLMRKYLWRSFLTRRYDNSAATRSLQDFRGLRDVLQGIAQPRATPVFDLVEYPLPTIQDLLGVGWPKNKDIVARGLLAITIKRSAVDLADGSPVSIDHLVSREYHHLFPDSLLTDDGGLTAVESYRALNCALITWNTNRNISAKEPLQYIQERVLRSQLGEQEIKSRLASHLIPFDQINMGGYANLAAEERKSRINADYAAFLEARANLFLPAIQTLCEGQNWPFNA
jgi:hypothetical protein